MFMNNTKEMVNNTISLLNKRINGLEDLKGKNVLPEEDIDYLINNYKESIENFKKILGD